MIVSIPCNKWDRCSDSTTVKIIGENQNKLQPKADVGSEPNITPLKNLGQQQENQWLRGPSENQPSEEKKSPQDCLVKV
jgi:hypothetical protein